VAVPDSLETKAPYKFILTYLLTYLHAFVRLSVVLSHCRSSMMLHVCYKASACVCVRACVCVLFAAGEMLSVAGPFLEQQMHPTVIIGAFRQALDDLLTILKDQVSVPVDISDRAEMTRIIKSCIGTKLITKWSRLFVLLVLCDTE